MIEGDEGVVEGDGDVGEAHVVTAWLRQALQLAPQVVAEEARRAALEWRQLGLGHDRRAGQFLGQDLERTAVDDAAVDPSDAVPVDQGAVRVGRDEGIAAQAFDHLGAVQEQGVGPVGEGREDLERVPVGDLAHRDRLGLGLDGRGHGMARSRVLEDKLSHASL